MPPAYACKSPNVFQYGAPSRTRTGTPYSGGFSYHYSFRYHFCLWSGLYLHHCSRFRCLPSSLYTFNSISTEAWLGISILQPSPNLTDSTPKISLRALKLSISPLRLPIPSSGHDIFNILKSVADFSAYMCIIHYILFTVNLNRVREFYSANSRTHSNLASLAFTHLKLCWVLTERSKSKQIKIQPHSEEKPTVSANLTI